MSVKFLNACKDRNPKMISNFWKMHRRERNIEFLFLCEYGHISIIEWLWCEKIPHITIHNISGDFTTEYNLILQMEYTTAFYLACKNEHFPVMEWLWSICVKIGIPVIVTYKYPECEYGQLSVVEWLWNKSFQSGSLQDFYEPRFYTACQNGHLYIAKWLWDKGVENGYLINIHSHTECAFRQACGNGHLPVVKWLWDKGIEIGLPFNIHIDHDYALYLACDDGHIPVVKWLTNKGKEIGSPFAIENIDIWHRGGKGSLYFLKLGFFPKKFSTPLLRLWKKQKHSVQLVRKNEYLIPILCEIIVNYI